MNVGPEFILFLIVLSMPKSLSLLQLVGLDTPLLAEDFVRSRECFSEVESLDSLLEQITSGPDDLVVGEQK